MAQKRSDIPPHEELMHNIKNKYQFILAASKRARMLVAGAPTKKDENGRNVVAGVKPTMIALGEILGGHIPWTIKENEDK